MFTNILQRDEPIILSMMIWLYLNNTHLTKLGTLSFIHTLKKLIHFQKWINQLLYFDFRSKLIHWLVTTCNRKIPKSSLTQILPWAAAQLEVPPEPKRDVSYEHMGKLCIGKMTLHIWIHWKGDLLKPICLNPPQCASPRSPRSASTTIEVPSPKGSVVGLLKSDCFRTGTPPSV